ncbi:MAG: hypothetical protein P1V20_28060 [Verrucomicrobiales bacterium]|nr:hypothetical protein [Verrucomicrobiales bacterium]
MNPKISEIAHIDFNNAMCGLEDTLNWILLKAREALANDEWPRLTYSASLLVVAYDILTENFDPDDAQEVLFKRYDQTLHKLMDLTTTEFSSLYSVLERIRLSDDLIEGYSSVLGPWHEEDQFTNPPASETSN